MVAALQPHLQLGAASSTGWQPWRALQASAQQQARPRPPLALPPRHQRWAALTHAASEAAQPESTALNLVVSAPTPQAILKSCSSAWPDWAKNGYRLLKVADAPSPSEAAAILKAVAKRALKLPRTQRAVLLQRNRVVLGLVECLQLATSRGAHSSSSSSSAAWQLSSSAALLPSSIEIAAAAASEVAAPAAAASEVAAAAAATAGAAAAAVGPSTQPALAPAELSGAMWSLAVLGEDEYFEKEMEALAAQLPGIEFDRLLQVADICWALATARHWSPHLALLEDQAERIVVERLAATCPSSGSSSGGSNSSSSGSNSSSSGSNSSSSNGGPNETRNSEPGDGSCEGSLAAEPGGGSIVSSGGDSGTESSAQCGELASSLPVSTGGGSLDGGDSGLAGDSSTSSSSSDASSSSSDASSSSSSGPSKCAQVATAVWGLSVLGHPPLRLLGLLPRLLQLWEQQDRLCQAAEAGDGSAASDSDGSAGSWAEQGGPRRTAASIPSLCSLAWSMAVAGQTQHEACRLVLATLARRCCGEGSAGSSWDGADTRPLPGVGRKQLMQLQQVSLALGGREAALQWVLACPEEEEQEEQQQEGLASEAAAALEQLFARAEEAAESWAGDARNQKVSACQADVAATVVSLGLHFSEECQVAPGLVVDAAVPSLQLAVEVDGPSHFTRNPVPLSRGQSPVVSRLPVGATLLKHHLLRRSGWAVAHVGTAEWEQLRGPEQKREHLERAIRQAGAAVHDGVDSW